MNRWKQFCKRSPLGECSTSNKLQESVLLLVGDGLRKIADWNVLASRKWESNSMGAGLRKTFSIRPQDMPTESV